MLYKYLADLDDSELLPGLDADASLWTLINLAVPLWTLA